VIRTRLAHLHISAQTHPGMGKRQNEDRYAVSSFQLGEKDTTPAVFAIVSDGIGGHRAGEFAAEMAVETISQLVAQSDGRQPLAILEHAIQAVSDAIADQARDNTQRLGMGTTCACVWVIGWQLYIASVGDSRVYLLRDGQLLQLTIDHTWVQEAMDKGILSKEDARHHPNLHVIRRYLGSTNPPQADTRLRLASEETDTQARSNQDLRLLPGDLLLLCTDGLTDVLQDEQILEAIQSREPEAAARQLIDEACAHNAQDNITAVLMLVPAEAARPTRRRRPFWVYALLALGGLCLLAVLVALGTWLAVQVFLPSAGTPTPGA
jgi:serine/threonine protein phosphatase PrpC